MTTCHGPVLTVLALAIAYSSAACAGTAPQLPGDLTIAGEYIKTADAPAFVLGMAGWVRGDPIPASARVYVLPQRCAYLSFSVRDGGEWTMHGDDAPKDPTAPCSSGVGLGGIVSTSFATDPAGVRAILAGGGQVGQGGSIKSAAVATTWMFAPDPMDGGDGSGNPAKLQLLPAMPVPRAYAASVWVPQIGGVLVAGGADGGVAHAEVHALKLSNGGAGEAGNWTTLASVPQVLYGASLGVFGELVAIAGGTDGRLYLEAVYTLRVDIDGFDQRWNLVANVTVPDSGGAFAASLVFGCQLWLFGGLRTEDSSGTIVSVVDITPGGSGNDLASTSLHTGTSHAAAVLLGSTFVIIGGDSSGGGSSGEPMHVVQTVDSPCEGDASRTGPSCSRCSPHYFRQDDGSCQPCAGVSPGICLPCSGLGECVAQAASGNSTNSRCVCGPRLTGTECERCAPPFSQHAAGCRGCLAGHVAVNDKRVCADCPGFVPAKHDPWGDRGNGTSCSGHGMCGASLANSTNMLCQCTLGWYGQRCDVCASGFGSDSCPQQPSFRPVAVATQVASALAFTIAALGAAAAAAGLPGSAATSQPKHWRRVDAGVWPRTLLPIMQASVLLGMTSLPAAPAVLRDWTDGLSWASLMVPAPALSRIALQSTGVPPPLPEPDPSVPEWLTPPQLPRALLYLQQALHVPYYGLLHFGVLLILVALATHVGAELAARLTILCARRKARESRISIALARLNASRVAIGIRACFIRTLGAAYPVACVLVFTQLGLGTSSSDYGLAVLLLLLWCLVAPICVVVAVHQRRQGLDAALKDRWGAEHSVQGPGPADAAGVGSAAPLLPSEISAITAAPPAADGKKKKKKKKVKKKTKQHQTAAGSARAFLTSMVDSALGAYVGPVVAPFHSSMRTRMLALGTVTSFGESALVSLPTSGDSVASAIVCGLLALVAIADGLAVAYWRPFRARRSHRHRMMLCVLKAVTFGAVAAFADANVAGETWTTTMAVVLLVMHFGAVCIVCIVPASVVWSVLQTACARRGVKCCACQRSPDAADNGEVSSSSDDESESSGDDQSHEGAA